MSFAITAADAGGFPAHFTEPSTAPVIASVAANQPICDALLAKAATFTHRYDVSAYRRVAVTIAGAYCNLFSDTQDNRQDGWVSSRLDEEFETFVYEFIDMTNLKALYNNGSNPSALFPYFWGRRFRDDIPVPTAVEVLTDLLDSRDKAYEKYYASSSGSDYASAFVYYKKYKTGTLAWIKQAIMDMDAVACA